MKKLKCLNNKKGMTLVEVMAAFVILLMGMSALIHATTLSLKIINQSRKVQVEADAASSDYYKNVSGGIQSENGEDVTISLVPDDGGDAGDLDLRLYTYISPSSDKLEGGRYLYYFHAGGGTDED